MIRKYSLPVIALCAGLVLTACGSDTQVLQTPPDIDTSPRIACKVVQCECVAPSQSIFSKAETTELTWEENGDASCPPGFTLKRIETDFLGRRKN